MKLFASGVAALAVAWGGLYLNASPGPGEYSRIDRFLVHEITLAFALAAIVMVMSRRYWTFRAVGLFLTSLGTALLYGLSSWLADGRSLSPGVREGWLDLARAGLGLGGAMVIIGLVFYVFGFFAFRDDVLTASDEQYTAANNPGRRASDRLPQ